jgi:hypothetical protein
MSHASRPYSSTDECLMQERDNYCIDTYGDGVRGRDEAKSTGFIWIIPTNSSVSCYVNTVVSTLELNPPRND